MSLSSYSMMIAPLIIDSYRRVYGGRSIPEDLHGINNSSALSQATRVNRPTASVSSFSTEQVPPGDRSSIDGGWAGAFASRLAPTGLAAYFSASAP
jgi:hypothetical protein